MDLTIYRKEIMKRYISIKPIKQKFSYGCTIACLRMVLNYYGVKASHEEIYDSILKVAKGASYNTEMALFARRKGFDVDCFAYNLYYTDPKDKNLSREKLLSKLQRKSKDPKRDGYYNQMLKSTVNCLKEGVNYFIQKPDFKLFVSYLEKEIPLIVSVNYAALHDSQGDPFESHDIVLAGIKDCKFIYIDPEHAKEERISNDDLLFSIYSRKITSASAYMLAIKPAKKR